MSLKDIKAKWTGFGFEVIEINGNNYDEILDAFDKAKTIKGKPTLILAHTIKGKGVSFMENEVAWHHGVLNDEQYHQAMSELGGAV